MHQISEGGHSGLSADDRDKNRVDALNCLLQNYIDDQQRAESLKHTNVINAAHGTVC